ncbi:MAG: alkaline phosphatase family protein [Saprospiraceae bacterium]
MEKSLNSLRSFYRFIPALFFLLLAPHNISSQDVLPSPDHIVILILENHAYSQIIGSSAAPYINALAGDSYTALFTESYAVEHPSQPNYLDLYSGCNQGVTSDGYPAASPFTTANLGRQLIDGGKTFITYSEGLPYVGFNGASSGAYVRKHNPAANWMGSGINQIPTNTNLPFSAFPSSDYSALPTVSFVIPTQSNDMHNGSDPYRITNADNWVNYNLDGYIQWAKTHNSLFILTFDEDNGSDRNHIATIFNGQMVKNGQYADTINHYTILRTIEDMYGLPYACNAATAMLIINCWNSITGLNETISDSQPFSIFPNPADNNCTLQIENSNFSKPVVFEIVDIVGHKILSGSFEDSMSKEIELRNTDAGIYFIKVSDGKRSSVKKLILE